MCLRTYPALHAASSYPGAQFYMECAQISITGGSGSKSPATVAFPGAYHGTDPGTTFVQAPIHGVAKLIRSRDRRQDQHLPDPQQLHRPR